MVPSNAISSARKRQAAPRFFNFRACCSTISKYSRLKPRSSARATDSRCSRGESVGPKRTSASWVKFFAVLRAMPSLAMSYGERLDMSLRMPIAWLVRAINSSYLSMPSTLKRKHKPALGEGQNPVDNYVDTSRNRQSYPQADGLGFIDKRQ